MNRCVEFPNFFFVLIFSYALFPKATFKNNAIDFRLSVCSINMIYLNVRIFSLLESITFNLSGVKYFLLVSLWATQSTKKCISSSTESVLQFWHRLSCIWESLGYCEERQTKFNQVCFSPLFGSLQSSIANFRCSISLQGNTYLSFK